MSCYFLGSVLAKGTAVIKNMKTGLLTIILSALSTAAGADIETDFRKIESEITFIQGDIDILEGKAIAHVGPRFEYLDAHDSRRVLAAKSIVVPDSLVGLLIPADSSPFQADAWYATITYVDTGHVSVDGVDLSSQTLLHETRRALAVDNQANRVKGLNTTELLGWVSEPTYAYDADRMSWSYELSTGDSTTVHHNVVTLGRSGYLSIHSAVDAENDPVAVRVPDLERTLEFADGFRHQDFVPEEDGIANFRLDSLVTGNFEQDSKFVAALASVTGENTNRILLSVLIVLLVIVLIRQHAASSKPKHKPVRHLNTKKLAAKR